jgi:hypothetical protein
VGAPFDVALSFTPACGNGTRTALDDDLGPQPDVQHEATLAAGRWLVEVLRPTGGLGPVDIEVIVGEEVE